MHYFQDIPAVTKPIPSALLDRDLKIKTKHFNYWIKRKVQYFDS